MLREETLPNDIRLNGEQLVQAACTAGTTQCVVLDVGALWGMV